MSIRVHLWPLPIPSLLLSLVPRKPPVAAIVILLGTIITSAALLQWFWAGWSIYNGPGPGLAARWLLTGVLGAALLLPPGAALNGAAVGRWLRQSGACDQARVTPAGTRQLARWAGLRVLTLPLLMVTISLALWALVAGFAPAAARWTGDPSGMSAAGVGLREIATAHGLVAVIAGAFALWGAALAVRKRASPSDWVSWRQSGGWAAPALLLITAMPALLGPLLPHLARPEQAIDAALLVNPVTAPGAALGMDLLRSPHLYHLTRAPEYWYTYPPALAVAGVYLMAAALGGYRLRRAIERN